MSTTIDSLQIEIQTKSNNAATSINDLEKALKKLNKNGDVSSAVTNLNKLRQSLGAFINMPSSASKIESLANSLKSLKKVGPIDLGASLGGVKTAMESLKSINIDGVAPQIERIAEALTPLNDVKGSGFNAMMNGLKKLDEVAAGLTTETIDRFVEKIKELDEKLGPVSQKLVDIGNAFKGVNSKALTASGGFSVFDGSVNTTTLNLQSMINVAKDVWSALQPVVNLLKNTIGEAIEWDGIEYQFGNAFGEQADEYYNKIVQITDALKINKQMFMENSAMAASMLKGFGVSSEDAREMGLGYTELAYDIWAAYNNVYKSLDGADGAMAAVRSAIAGEVEPIRRAGFTIVESQLEITAANHGLAYSSEKATEAQKSYLRYLTLVDQAQTKGIIGTYASEMDTAEGMMRTFRQQLTSLAQTFGSIFLPVLTKVMPWLQAFVDLLGDAISAVASFFGIDIQKVDFSDGSEGLSSISDSANSATGAVNGTTDALTDLKNATLGFDELNVISPNTESSSGSGTSSGSGSGYDGLDVGSIWDESIFGQIQFEVDAIKEQLKEALSGITAVISGFALAVGTILVVSGANIPVGLGLMAIGAVGLVATIAENWSSMSDQLAKTLLDVTSILSGFLLAIGAFLAFSGVNVGLGVALMAAGAVSLATAATINWKFLEGNFKSTLSILTGIVSGGLLAMGALFAFTGVSVGLGIALMAIGAVGLVTAAALNWDSLSEPMRKAIGTLSGIVGGALFTFGAILAFSGNIPLGIGLMVAGAVSLASAVALNWDSLTGDLKNTLATLGTIVGGALLGVGVILALTGAATGLGIAMIAAGAVSIIAAAPINWNSLVNSIKDVLKEIGIAVGAALLALGILLVCTGVALPVGIALIAVGAASLVTGVALNWDSITEKVKKFFKDIGIIAGAAMLTLGILLVCTGVGIPLGIGLIAAGAASLVAGVALNWDSIKTSVQNALEKIKEWVKTYGLLALGVILCLTGAGIPIGLALIKQGLDTKTENGSTVGDDLLKTIKEKWNAVKKWWNSKPALKKVSAAVENFKAKVSDAWNSAKEWWNNKKAALKKYTPSIGDIKEKVSTAWSNARSWWDNKKAALKQYTPTIGSIKDKVSSAWTTAKNWWNNNKGSMSYTPTVGSIVDKLSSAWNTAKTWWNNNVKLSIPSLSLNVTYTTEGLGTVKKAIVNALGLQGWPKLSFAANGGIFDAGSLVWAGESGPEIVANAGGGKTGVMNVRQMSDAVYEGVYSAVMAAMSGNSNQGNQDINIYLDGKKITASVEKHQKERGANLMTGGMAYGY